MAAGLGIDGGCGGVGRVESKQRPKTIKSLIEQFRERFQLYHLLDPGLMAHVPLYTSGSLHMQIFSCSSLLLAIHLFLFLPFPISFKHHFLKKEAFPDHLSGILGACCYVVSRLLVIFLSVACL